MNHAPIHVLNFDCHMKHGYSRKEHLYDTKIKLAQNMMLTYFPSANSSSCASFAPTVRDFFRSAVSLPLTPLSESNCQGTNIVSN